MSRCGTKYAVMALAVAAIALAAAAALKGAALRKGRAAEGRRRALASLAPDIARLEAVRHAEALLSAEGALPDAVPLSVALPPPMSEGRRIEETAEGLKAAVFSLSWKVPPKTALELLAALCNLDDGWRIVSLSLRDAGDGERLALDAEVAGAPGNTAHTR